MGTDQALKEYPDLFKEHYGTIVPPEDNKFSALNSAVWSGGSFVYVPPGVEVPLPLQAYFRINGENTGQFERTLIIVDEGAAGALHRGLHGAHLRHRFARTSPSSRSSPRRAPRSATRPSRTGPTTSTTW